MDAEKALHLASKHILVVAATSIYVKHAMGKKWLMEVNLLPKKGRPLSSYMQQKERIIVRS